MTPYNLARNPIRLALVSILLFASTAAASPVAVVTQMYDNLHTGWNPNETQLTIANVKSSFKLLFKDQTAADPNGQTYSQPLYIPNLNMGKLGTHNVIFVAAENNTVDAFDADAAGAPLWSKNLTPSGETLQVAADYDNDRVPQIGITGTPVIDPATNTIYLVAASKTTASPVTFHQRLHAMDITNGNERPNSPVDITAKYPGTGGTMTGRNQNGNVVFDPLWEFNRPAMLLAAGNVYTVFGSHEDNGEYQGWVIAYDKASLAQTGVFNTSPNLDPGVGGGAIWQASMGPVADDSSIYALTANGPFDNTASNYGDSAIRLNLTGLALQDFFTPCNQQVLNVEDVDLGSGGMMLLPEQPTGPLKLATFTGKEGSIYLVDRTAMGSFTAPNHFDDTMACNDDVIQKLWRVLGTAPTTDPTVGSNRDAFWGAPAYFRDSSGHQYVYFPGDYAPITEFDLSNATLTAGTVAGGKPNQTPSSTYNFPHGGTIPVISSNGGDTSTAILWAIRRALPPSGAAGPLTLDAFSAIDLTNQIVVDIPAGQWNFKNDAFLIPTIANGKVYIASGGEIDVFGIDTPQQAVPGAIKISRARINFGKVRIGKTKAENFRIRNAGKGDLHITIASLQAPFQIAGGTLTLAKGKSSPPIAVQFTPTASGVMPPQMLTISSDDPKHPSETMTILGKGK